MSKLETCKAAILDAISSNAPFDCEGVMQLAQAYATLVDADYRQAIVEQQRGIDAKATAREVGE